MLMTSRGLLGFRIEVKELLSCPCKSVAQQLHSLKGTLKAADSCGHGKDVIMTAWGLQGPRQCIGQPLAKMMHDLGVAMLFANFRFKLARKVRACR